MIRAEPHEHQFEAAGDFFYKPFKGGIADHEALQETLSTGLIAGADPDVFREERPDPDGSPLPV